MVLPQLKDFDFQGKRVLVRCDLDVPLRKQQSNPPNRRATEQHRLEVGDDERLKECLPTINYLLEHEVKEIILLGHLGRPDGKVVPELSLKPIAERLWQILGRVGDFREIGEIKESREKLILAENLRFDQREEKNDVELAKELASLGDFYVNEAFASSHREHASIVGVPKFLPHCPGFHFASEVENLSKVLENPQRPLVFVIGGAKPETKLPLVEEFAKKADWVLVGGALGKEGKEGRGGIEGKVFWAKLTKDGFDISSDSIEEFSKIIRSAGTVVWNGPMGKFEEKRWETGTRRVAEAIRDFRGFGVVGGGDTITALKKFELLDKIDYVSSGGGAMLELLAKGTLPGIEALI